METNDHVRALITRLARLEAADIWAGDLNPAQVSALEYLSRANRFSRSPSHVAEYLGTTRGTTSQTLKALVRKGYARECQSETDKRSISFALTEAGLALARRQSALAVAIDALPTKEQAALQESLLALLTARLSANGGRAFGLCKTCVHHRSSENGAYCALLSLALAPEEAEQICHEQVSA